MNYLRPPPPPPSQLHILMIYNNFYHKHPYNSMVLFQPQRLKCNHKSRNVQERTFGHVLPAKVPAHTSCLIRDFAERILDSQGAKFLHEDNEGSDQTTRMHRLICLRWAHMSEGTFSDVAAHSVINAPHYENTPIQINWIFQHQNWKFSDKKFWYFSYFCSKHRLWVHVRTASARRF